MWFDKKPGDKPPYAATVLFQTWYINRFLVTVVDTERNRCGRCSVIDTVTNDVIVTFDVSFIYSPHMYFGEWRDYAKAAINHYLEWRDVTPKDYIIPSQELA